MGNMQQMGWAEAVSSGGVALEGALMASFQGNFYPPLDLGLVGPTAEAIRAAVPFLYEPEELHGTWVTLPDGLHMLPRDAVQDDAGTWVVRVVDLIEATRAWSFVEALAAEENTDD